MPKGNYEFDPDGNLLLRNLVPEGIRNPPLSPVATSLLSHLSHQVI